MKSREIRRLGVTEVRVKRDGEKPVIAGYAAVFNSLSEPLTTRSGKCFRERIAPGAFKRSISGGQDIVALVDHDPRTVIARTSSGTLKLWEDDKGLAFEIKPPDTTAARDLIANIEHGNHRGVSFGFADPVDDWVKEEGENVRTLRDMELGEVSVTPFPAYPDTSIDVRSIDRAIAKLEHPGNAAEREARAVVQYDDGSIVSACNDARQKLRDAFDAMQRAIVVVSQVEGELSDADEQAIEDFLDEVGDMKAKCRQAVDACDCDDDDEDKDEEDEAGDGDELMRHRLRIQQLAQMGLATANLRAAQPAATA